MLYIIVFLAVSLLVLALRPPVPPESQVEDDLLNNRQTELRGSNDFYPVLLAVGGFLGRYSVWFWDADRLNALRLKLRQTGWPAGLNPREYLGICLACGLFVGIIFELTVCVCVGFPLVLPMVLGTWLGTLMAIRWVDDHVKERARVIDRRLPHVLDMITVGMEAGATFHQTLGWVCGPAPREPLDAELRVLSAEMEMGRSREEAFESLLDRVPSQSLKNVVTTILRGERLGTPLKILLRSQAQTMRQHRILAAEQRAHEAATKLLAPNLMILVAALAVVLGPAITQMVNAF